jgi:antitoxin component YwqK of YwqJK toxin-antitoxin module
MYKYILGLMMLTTSVVSANNFGSEYNTRYNQLPGELTEVTYYYTTGEVKQVGYMENGLKTGEWITYSKSGGVTAKAYFENGVKVGKWKVYDENGELTYKIQYRDGVKVWAQQYDTDGNTIAFNYK